MASSNKADQAAAPDEGDVRVETGVKSENLGNPNTGIRRELAEDLPERDEVQKAYKEAMTTDSMQAEVRAKVQAVDASPNAADTPSGGAMKAVAGVGNDTERGERYTQEKAARRWGYPTSTAARS